MGEPCQAGCELKPDAGIASHRMAAPTFEIPSRPERHFASDGGMEYRGGTVFELEPATPGHRAGEDNDVTPDLDEADLVDRVDDVLQRGPYQSGAFHDLPMPLWLVRDRETGDAFRVAVRNGEIRLHVLPGTESAGLRAFYERLRDSDGPATEWTVRTRVRD